MNGRRISTAKLSRRERHSFGRVTDEADPWVDREALLFRVAAQGAISLRLRVIEVYTRPRAVVAFCRPRELLSVSGRLVFARRRRRRQRRPRRSRNVTLGPGPGAL